MNKVRDIDIEQFNKLVWEYINFCEEHKLEVPTPKGTICKVTRRKTPTISYFLLIWMRRHYPRFYSRAAWYKILNDPDHENHILIKAAEEAFKALAVDVVANEGTGIFYAKNKLGMSEKSERTDTHITKLIIEQKGKDLPPIKSEKELING
jgi:hypothetical protein